MQNNIYLIQEEGKKHYTAVPLTPENIFSSFAETGTVTVPCEELVPWTDLRLLAGQASGFVEENRQSSDNPNSVERRALEEIIGKIKKEFDHPSVTAVLLSQYIGKNNYGPEGKFHAAFTMGAVGCNIFKK